MTNNQSKGAPATPLRPLEEARFHLLSGPIKSPNDGDRQFIGVERLEQSYGVPAKACTTTSTGARGLIPLLPLDSGGYEERLTALLRQHGFCGWDAEVAR